MPPRVEDDKEMTDRQDHAATSEANAGENQDPRNTPATPSTRQTELVEAARQEAVRRDTARRALSYRRDRTSLTGGPLRRTPTKQSEERESDSSIKDEASGEDEEAFKFKQPLHSTGYKHGYTSQEWSKELEELKVPQLLLATPEAILDFKIEWKNYSDAVDNIAAKQGRRLQVKSVFDCIEKHNRIYICGVANLLPRELQGHPNDVSHAVIHDLIMTEGVKQASSRTMRLTNAIAKITIDLQGRSGKQSIHAAWINLSKLEEKFEATVDPKILIKWLLKNLRPKQTKLVIESLQNAGTAREKETRTNVFAFHEMLMDIADTNRKAIDYGLTAPADSRPQGRALVVSTGTVVRPKHLDTRISHG